MAIIDLVSWSPQDNETIFAYKYPETNLSTYTQLIVQESQEAILFSKGQIAGKFGPGKHTLNTENLPILRSLFGLPFGGKNPFTAEVWFVNKIQPYNIEWEIDRMDIHDVDYNTGIPLVARGRYGLKIVDAEKFLIKIVGTKNSFTQVDLTDQFFGEFSTKTKSSILQFMITNKIGLKQISAFLDSISEHLKSAMMPFWGNLGFDLSAFYISSIEVDSSNEAGRRVLDAISRQSAQAIGGYSWQQEQAFGMANNAIDNFSNNNSGILGAVIASNMMNGLGGAALGGGILQPQHNQPSFQNQGAQVPPQNNPIQSDVKEVFCSNCSKKFPCTHSFCPHCGDSYDACPKCGTDNDKTAKRCVSCGTQLKSESTICYSCHSPMNPGVLFCGNCGKQQNENCCTRCNTALSTSVKFCPKCGQKR
jgi:membrane protease subunit (stomatin/prohibitin family)